MPRRDWLPVLLVCLFVLATLAPLAAAQAQDQILPQPSVASPLAQDVTIAWNTFAGNADIDHGYDIAVDGSGNVYVVGTSLSTWGAPITPFAGGSDAFVAKFNSEGELQWNTFLGGTGTDTAYKVAASTTGNIYVTGFSGSGWGTPVRSFQGNGDAFVAMLNTDGLVQWNTFLGGTGADEGRAIAVDASGNSYVSGLSLTGWGTPIGSFGVGANGFVAKLNGSGILQWNTFVGEKGNRPRGIALDASGNILVTGNSPFPWGNPINPYHPYLGAPGTDDIFAAKLDPAGNLTWNTFLGDSAGEVGRAVIADASGNVYLTGISDDSWGSPIRPFVGPSTSFDGFVAKLSSSGDLQWNTFLGGTGGDDGTGIALGRAGTIDVGGYSSAVWGSPVLHYVGAGDGFVAELSNDGTLQWHGFLGSMFLDVVNGIATDKNGKIWIAGDSYGPWGSGPTGSAISPYKGGPDAMVALLQEGAAYNVFLPIILR